MISIPSSDSLEALQASRRLLLEYVPTPIATASQCSAGWRIAAASVRGPAHVRGDTPRQDAFCVEPAGEAVIACIADGLGSQARSYIGARLAVERVSSDLASAISVLPAGDLSSALLQGGTGSLGDVVRGAVSQAVREAQKLMEMSPGPGFATTLAGVVAHPAGGFFFHVGDGVALAYSIDPARTSDTQIPTMSPPENGEFDDITFAIDADPSDPHLRFTSFAASELIVLMTDGPMPFALGKGQSSLADKFYRPMSAHLWSEAGLAQAGQMLADALDAPGAAQISDDDKTILLLRREV